MFCYQCQETAGNTGCTVRGVCGKQASTAGLQDVLVHLLKGIAVFGERAPAQGVPVADEAQFVRQGLFATITNANFDDARFLDLARRAQTVRDTLRRKVEDGLDPVSLPDAATWTGAADADFTAKAETVGVQATADADARSLRELLIYGVKGLSAYADHAAILGQTDPEVDAFIMKALASTTRELPVADMTALVLECGATGVKAMALLDKANTDAYGHPEITRVNLGVRGNPGILVSGHDLKDMAELLEQTAGTGVDVYTHSEMLPANAYPAFKRYDHFVGNYGGSWWRQSTEFDAFQGAVLMTTNCITPVKDAYRDRLFTTGMAGYPGCAHIPDRTAGRPKDFSAVIEKAKTCPPPEPLEEGTLTNGFARNQVMALADTIIAAVKSGAIKRFVVMAGCDGRFKERRYYTDVARALPDDTVILTAGCAKYRYNKLDLGEIGGIPRVLDAGQCNDSYSLAYIALQLQKAFGLDDINDLPISYDIAWYEQKAVIVLLALLSLGVKGIRLGPTLPAFLSPGVAKVLVEQFDIKGSNGVAQDVEAMLAGR
ncbi:MAG: hydroxylamine reductase [Lentisphaerae bacterium]|nr:hydroxylamine reductase [Lentisphaerota bacterium]